MGALPSGSARAREPAARGPAAKEGAAGAAENARPAEVNAGQAGLGVPCRHGAFFHPQKV